MAVDLDVFSRLKTKADYDQAAQEFAMKKQLVQTQLAKANEFDADKIGEQAFVKAAQGLPLTPQELAAAKYVDAKSGGVSFNPVTGEMIQKPRISDKIGIDGLGGSAAPPNADIALNSLRTDQGTPTPLPSPPSAFSPNPVQQRLEAARQVEVSKYPHNAKMQQNINEFYAKKGLELGEKSDEKQKTDQNLLNDALDANNKQLSVIEQLKQDPGLYKNFGLLGSVPNIPGGKSADAAEDLRRVNALSFITALGNMKSQSKTGASGLGALSEREGDKVQSAAAALGKSQSYESFQKNLKVYQDELKASNDRLTGGFNNIYGQGDGASAPPPAPVQVNSEAEILNLPAGTKFIFNGKTGTTH